MGSKTSKTAASLAIFPPYGYVNSDFQWDVDTRRVPEGFAIDGRTATPLEWRDYVNTVVAEMSDFLWPEYIQKTNSWRGASAANVVDLTMADFKLLESIQKNLLATVECDGRSLAITHKAMFIDEDIRLSNLAFLPTIDAYIPNIKAELLVKFKDTVRQKLVGLGPAQLRFKEKLQRPRPYQMAFILNRKFDHEWANLR